MSTFRALRYLQVRAKSHALDTTAAVHLGGAFAAKLAYHHGLLSLQRGADAAFQGAYTPIHRS